MNVRLNGPEFAVSKDLHTRQVSLGEKANEFTSMNLNFSSLYLLLLTSLNETVTLDSVCSISHWLFFFPLVILNDYRRQEGKEITFSVLCSASLFFCRDFFKVILKPNG